VTGRSFAAVVLALVALAAATVEKATSSSGRIECGVERWTVKTLQDRPILLPAQATTIAFLTSRPAPAYLPVTRLPFELHIFTVTAAVTLIRHEADDDYHAVLSDGRRTMIAESPAATCDSRASLVRRAQMAAARSALRPCARARVTGVAFFDFPHGQTGVAPNAIELHPILAFRCLTGSASAGAVGGSGSSGGSSSAGVRLINVTSPVSAGSDASLTVSVLPAQTCAITVYYESGPSQAAGLYPQRALASPGRGGRDEYDAGPLADSRLMQQGRLTADILRCDVGIEDNPTPYGR
jgi:hypothetical protein